MWQGIREHLIQKKLLQPRIVSTADLFDAVEILFLRRFHTLEDLLEASVTDLVVVDFREEGKIQQVRALIEHVAKKPQGAYQVFVLLGIDNLTEQASNALLKTFEDIQPSSLFLLTCTSQHALLPTILSRVVVVSTDTYAFNQDDEIASEVSDFLLGKHSPLLARILGNKIDRSQCLQILDVLQSKIKDGSIYERKSIDTIVAAKEAILTSNVTAKYQLDTVLFELLKGNASS